MNKSAEEALLQLKQNNSTQYVIINSRQHRVLLSNLDRSSDDKKHLDFIAEMLFSEQFNFAKEKIN